MAEQLPTIVEFSEDIATAKQPDPLPTGEYLGTIRAAQVKRSQRDTKYGEAMFFISSDQYPADYKDGNPDGVSLAYRRVSLEDNPMARYQARRFSESIGSPMQGRTIDVSRWVGLSAKVTVSHEEYEGTIRAVITKVGAA